jgi:hypothetical protein
MFADGIANAAERPPNVGAQKKRANFLLVYTLFCEIKTLPARNCNLIWKRFLNKA